MVPKHLGMNAANRKLNAIMKRNSEIWCSVLIALKTLPSINPIVLFIVGGVCCIREYEKYRFKLQSTKISPPPVERFATNSAHGAPPEWLEPTHNLETQLSQLLGDYYTREKAGVDNLWILKPWNMERTIDTTVTQNLSAIIRLMETGPKIFQKYIEHPTLFKGRKFDLRYIVRLANNTYSLDMRSLFEYETHFTVMVTYCPDCARACKYDTEAIRKGGEVIKGSDFYNYVFGCLFLNETAHTFKVAEFAE
ncbi:tubulin--tyrosine ligase-like protein 12 [Forsythia ovata]|uniref:Tubulin--tyrosine ligase-like protein 12 n=1 Tax=Forsythia ovata TaxID=205694 RepID=A0ABD1XAT6_9LAMI